MTEPQEPKLEHAVTRRGEVSVLSIRGRMDAARVGPLRAALAALPDQGHTRLVLDLAGLEWIDSSGVGALVSLFKHVKARGGEVKAAALQRQPKEVFRLLRLESVFELCDTVDQAAQRFARS